jgi:GH18 family chitinase
MKKFLLAFVLLTIAVFRGSAQDDETKADVVKKQIEEKSFVFKAQLAIPLKGRHVSLITSSFDVKISGDTVNVYLPYYGRSHTVVLGHDEDGIQFKSVRNKYKVNPKKNGWNVIVKPEDLEYAIELNFDISKSGEIMLNVKYDKKDPISFKGYLSS